MLACSPRRGPSGRRLAVWLFGLFGLFVCGLSASVQARTFAVLIAPEKFSQIDGQGYTLLQGAKKDLESARRIARTMGADEADIHEFDDSRPATPDSLRETYQRIARDMTREDRLLLYVSTHGTAVPEGRACVGKVALPESGARMKLRSLNDLIADMDDSVLSRARSVNILVDACFSGALKANVADASAKTQEAKVTAAKSGAPGKGVRAIAKIVPTSDLMTKFGVDLPNDLKKEDLRRCDKATNYELLRDDQSVRSLSNGSKGAFSKGPKPAIAEVAVLTASGGSEFAWTDPNGSFATLALLACTTEKPGDMNRNGDASISTEELQRCAATRLKESSSGMVTTVDVDGKSLPAKTTGQTPTVVAGKDLRWLSLDAAPGSAKAWFADLANNGRADNAITLSLKVEENAKKKIGVRFTVDSQRKGYITLLNAESDNRIRMIYPFKRSQTVSIEAGQRLMVPNDEEMSEGGWFPIGRPGVEHVLVAVTDDERRLDSLCPAGEEIDGRGIACASTALAKAAEVQELPSDDNNDNKNISAGYSAVCFEVDTRGAQVGQTLKLEPCAPHAGRARP
jgi:hypothetical protein